MLTNAERTPLTTFDEEVLPRVGDRASTSEVARQRIREFAILGLDEFASKGFEGTTLAGVARRSGVTQPLLHYYFGTKDALWRKSLDLAFDRMRDEFDKPPSRELSVGGAKGEESDRLEDFIRSLIRALAKNPSLLRVLSQESAAPSARLRWLTERHLRPLFETATASLQAKLPTSTSADSDSTLFMIIGASLGYLASRGLVETLSGVGSTEPLPRTYADGVVAFCRNALHGRDASAEPR